MLFKKLTVHRSALSLWLSAGFSRIISIIQWAIIARLVPAAEIGKYALVINLYGTGLPLFTMGSGPVIIRFIGRHQREGTLKDFIIRILYIQIFPIGILSIGIILLILTKGFNHQIFEVSNKLILIAIPMFIAALLYSLISFSFTGLQLFKAKMLQEMSFSLCFFITSIILLSFYPTAISLINTTTLTYIIVGVILGAFLFSKVIFKPENNFSKIISTLPEFYLNMFKFGGWFIPANCCFASFLLIDRYTITRFLGPDVTGLYHLTFSLVSILILFPERVAEVLVPKLSELHDMKINSDFLFQFTSRIILTIYLTFSLLIAYSGKWVLSFLYSSNYEQGAQILPVLFLAGSFRLLYTQNSIPIITSEKSFLLFLSICSGAIVNLILNLTLVPKMGLMGASLSMVMGWFVAFAGTLIANCFYLKMSYGLRYFAAVASPLAIIMTFYSFPLAVVLSGVLLYLSYNSHQRATFSKIIKEICNGRRRTKTTCKAVLD